MAKSHSVIFGRNFSPDILINSYANGETRVSKACNALVFFPQVKLTKHTFNKIEAH